VLPDGSRIGAAASELLTPYDAGLMRRYPVSDHDSVFELFQKAEGRDREEYALIALRIGLLSLKHARGQIDADVRHEGERLMLDLTHALAQPRGEIHLSLTSTHERYILIRREGFRSA
jgi:predicted unusual protein kinase regulating ubiquinone biosynthesis (AarF/ABC1/UbiB family)